MAAAVNPLVTTDEQRIVLEETLGSNPFKPSAAGKRNKGWAWTAAQRADKEAMLRETGRVKSVVIVNFNPFPLRVNGGQLFKDAVPACPVGDPYHAHVLKEVRWMTSDKGVGFDNVEQFDPIPYIPAVLATEYVREYVHERQTGGVLVFLGDGIPKDLDVMVSVPVQHPGGDGPSYNVIEQRNLKQMWFETIAAQNAQILKKIEEANTLYEDPSMRKNITDVDRDYARLAELRGILSPADRPRWVLNRNTLAQQGDRPDPCPLCATVPLPGAAMCVACNGYVFDVVKAYKANGIEYGHQSMYDATEEQWAEIEKIKARRDRIQSKRAKAQG